MTGPRRDSRRRALSWPLGRILGAAVAVMAAFSVAAILSGGFALSHLSDERQRIETTIDPAALAAEQLYSALLNQETGVRGYALSGQPDFLAPYTSGLAAEQAAVGQLRPLLPGLPAASAAQFRQTLSQADDWRTRYAEPTIRQVQASGKPVVSPDILEGKAAFDALRGKLAGFESQVSVARGQALSALDRASAELDAALVAIAVGLVVVIAAVALLLRTTAIRPVHVLADEARRVADGDFGHGGIGLGCERVFHLHRFENGERGAPFHLVSRFDEKLDHLAGHRRDDAVACGTGTVLAVERIVEREDLRITVMHDGDFAAGETHGVFCGCGCLGFACDNDFCCAALVNDFNGETIFALREGEMFFGIARQAEAILRVPRIGMIATSAFG